MASKACYCSQGDDSLFLRLGFENLHTIQAESNIWLSSQRHVFLSYNFNKAHIRFPTSINSEQILSAQNITSKHSHIYPSAMLNIPISRDQNSLLMLSRGSSLMSTGTYFALNLRVHRFEPSGCERWKSVGSVLDL